MKLIGRTLVVLLLWLPTSPLASGEDYYGWAVGDPTVHPPTTELRCPNGMFIKSIVGRENEWLAHIQIYCAAVAAPDLDKGGALFPSGNAGPDAGGDGGSDAHGFTLTCPGRVVDGLTGLLATATKVYQTLSLKEFKFAADLHAYCGGWNAPGQAVVQDTKFSRGSTVIYREMNALYPDAATQAHFHCPPNWGAVGLWYGLGNVARDDIAAVGLICRQLPVPASNFDQRQTRGAFSNQLHR
ncbi:MAG: hypothetical protein JO127_00765 [Caulobacteraceae bacterium]|nr:hypothetical protein [Caulobacteraceae bacterium]